jgi:long-chain acyl-CoA synthetase
LTYHGATIGFFQGDIQKLMEDIAELKPTIFVSVPRLYNRIYDKVLSSVKAAGGIKSTLFNHAFNAKKLWLEAGYVHHNIWDRIVFGAVRQKLGGRVKMMMTGAGEVCF